MRPAAILIAALLAVPGASVAQVAGLPHHTLSEAGEASVVGVLVCGLPPSTIDGMKQNVDTLIPGGTTSTEFAKGVAGANRTIQDIRDTPVPDFSEMKAVKCPEILTLISDLAPTN